VVVLFILTVATMRAVAAPARSANDVVVNVVGHRWWWEFDYPDLGIKTANELHMPVGTNVHLDLTSVDVIHSFWPPQLSGKFDAIPGQTNTMWLTSDVVGEYPGQCAEFCGLQHAHMGFTVVVESKEDFLAWASAQQQAAAQQAAAQPVAPPVAAGPTPGSMDDQMAQIQKLAQMKEQGLITDEEFQAKKKQILGI
jgi:cytochrome c oxidase subunit 2